MRRLPDWPQRLAAAIEAARLAPFAWGRHDCALFALDCIDAQTGGQIAARFRGTYDGPLGAAKVFGPAGLLGFAAGIARTEGLVPVGRVFAQRGSITCYRGDLGETLGILYGRQVLAAGPAGIARIELTAIDTLACWAVP